MSFQSYTCYKCHGSHEFYQVGSIVPPCPYCGYPEVKNNEEEYYRSMGVRIDTEIITNDKQTTVI